jgi:predicted DNA binding CopG/RHH family protein
MHISAPATSQRRSATLTLRVSPRELAALRQHAAREGLPVAAFARRALIAVAPPVGRDAPRGDA